MLRFRVQGHEPSRPLSSELRDHLTSPCSRSYTIKCQLVYFIPSSVRPPRMNRRQLILYSSALGLFQHNRPTDKITIPRRQSESIVLCFPTVINVLRRSKKYTPKHRETTTTNPKHPPTVGRKGNMCPDARKIYPDGRKTLPQSSLDDHDNLPKTFPDSRKKT